MAQHAGAERAPTVRLAERYAAWFLPLSLGMAGLAWLVSGSAERAVAVLVVATPCPLLLAAPVAVVSGLSRAARRGVIVRDGGSLERLGRARTLVINKTGTLTVGRPRVLAVAAEPGRSPSEVLRLAASLDQVSAHGLADAIVRESRARNLTVSMPADATEEPGRGPAGTVDGLRLAVGGSGLAPAALPTGPMPWTTAPFSTEPPSPGSPSTTPSPVPSCSRTRCATTPPPPSEGCGRPG